MFMIFQWLRTKTYKMWPLWLYLHIKKYSFYFSCVHDSLAQHSFTKIKWFKGKTIPHKSWVITTTTTKNIIPLSWVIKRKKKGLCNLNTNFFLSHNPSNFWSYDQIYWITSMDKNSQECMRCKKMCTNSTIQKKQP